MKRMLVAGSITALALIGTAGSASAAPDPTGPSCFGGIHKAINTADALGLSNVGELVKVAGGQGKNEAARGLCAAG